MATAFGVRLTLFPKILTYFNELTMMLPLSSVFYILKSYVLDIELKFQGEVTINITRKNEINVLKNPTYWRLLLSARLRFTIQFCNSNITKTAEVKKTSGLRMSKGISAIQRWVEGLRRSKRCEGCQNKDRCPTGDINNHIHQ